MGSVRRLVTFSKSLATKFDSSVVPHANFSADGGPDFTEIAGNPFWFGPTGSVLELPLTVGWCGLLRQHARSLEPLKNSTIGRRCHMAGVMARLGLFDRIRLTPEDMNFADLQRLTRTMLHSGKRLFSLTYHSPSLTPGHTPYVRDRAELDCFLTLIEKYCEFFFARCGGKPSTPQELRDSLVAPTFHPGISALSRVNSVTC